MNDNPFSSLAGGFGAPGSAPSAAPAPTAAPAPGFSSAPAPAAAPAPTAPVTPITEAPSLRPNAGSMNPATAGVDAFGTSRPPNLDASDEERHRIADDMGKAVLIRIHEIYRAPDKFNVGQEKDVAVVDWVVLDPENPQLRSDARIFNPGITKDLVRTLSDNKRFHVGRVGTIDTKKGKPAVILIPLSAEEAEHAKQAGAALGWF